MSLAGIKNKGEYEMLEIRRFVARHAITEFEANPFFPVNTLKIMRGAIAAQGLECFERYVAEVFRHMWAKPKKMDEADVIVQNVRGCELGDTSSTCATRAWLLGDIFHSNPVVVPGPHSISASICCMWGKATAGRLRLANTD